MFVDIPQSIQDLKNTDVPSIVTLFTQDPTFDFSRKEVNFSGVIFIEPGLRLKKFESQVVGTPSCLTQTPDQSFNGGSKVVDGLSD